MNLVMICFKLYQNRTTIFYFMRTGSGKSTLLRSLMRLLDVEGELLVGGANILELPLENIRQAFAIIPQVIHFARLFYFSQYSSNSNRLIPITYSSTLSYFL